MREGQRGILHFHYTQATFMSISSTDTVLNLSGHLFSLSLFLVQFSVQS